MTRERKGATIDTIRRAALEDHARMVRAIQDWWGDSRTPQEARELSLLLPRLFLQHFASTSYVIESGERIDAFLVGLHSPDRAGEAYIHFVGVSPSRRREGLARRLYERFWAAAREAGCDRVRAVTSPQNRGSVSFHLALGFELETDPSNRVPTVFEDYDGPGQHRHSLVRLL